MRKRQTKIPKLLSDIVPSFLQQQTRKVQILQTLYPHFNPFTNAKDSRFRPFSWVWTRHIRAPVWQQNSSALREGPWYTGPDKTKGAKRISEANCILLRQHSCQNCQVLGHDDIMLKRQITWAWMVPTILGGEVQPRVTLMKRNRLTHQGRIWRVLTSTDTTETERLAWSGPFRTKGCWVPGEKVSLWDFRNNGDTEFDPWSNKGLQALT